MTIVKTSANGHELRCHCEECSTSIKEQFKPFEMMTYTKKMSNATHPCPACKRQVWGKGRGGFLVWSCWSCNMKPATVEKVINGQQDKVFGFAKNTAGEVVYFHLTRQMIIQAVDDSEFPEMFESAGTITVPSKGDKILYAELKGEKGPKALWWAFAAEYDEALEAIKNRETFRLMERNGRKKLSRLDEVPTLRVRWEGKNLEDLRCKFGKLVLRDELYEAYYFEKLTAINLDGSETTWEPCDDPR